MLESGGFKTHTLLSKLPGSNKKLLHYVTAVEHNAHGRKHFIFDPEREASCDRKGYDFREYLLNMTYIKPEKYFYEHKVGPTGLGPDADEYLANIKPASVVGKNEVEKLFEIAQEMGEE